MATLYRPKVVSYQMPDGSYRTKGGQRVTKDTPGAVRIVTKSPTWFGRYTDAQGQRHQVKLSTSKEVARRMLAKLEGDAQLAGVGIADPFAESRARTLAEHLDDFGRYLAAKGDTEGYWKKTVYRCRVVLAGVGALTFEDLQPSAVLEFLAGLRQEVSARVPLPAEKEWFTRTELAAALGIHPRSVARALRRDGLEGRGNGKARRYPREPLLGLQERLCRGVGVSTTNHYLRALKGHAFQGVIAPALAGPYE